MTVLWAEQQSGDQEVAGSTPSWAMPPNHRQVVHTPVPLSPSSIIWYWPRDSDALWLGK